MATITVTYKGLTGVLGTVSIDDTLTLGALIQAIATDEGLQTDYYAISVENNPSINDTTYDDSTVTIGGTLPSGAGITAATRIVCTPRQDGTKERRQIQKLDIAAVKRSDTYDITQLPTQYSGNDVTDNPNSGGLLEGRPWAASAGGLSATLVMALDADGYSGSGDWLDSANSNDASLQGTPSYTATAPKFFDLVPSEGDYFSVADDSTLDNLTELSVEMWLNIDTINASGPNMLFSKRSTTSDGYVGFFTTTGWTFRFGTGTGTGLTYGTAPTTGSWQHMIMTIGSSGSKLYINNSEVATSAYTGNSGNVNTGAALDLFEVNPRPQTGPVRLDGKVGMVNFYSGVLSSGDVTTRWNATKARFGL